MSRRLNPFFNKSNENGLTESFLQLLTICPSLTDELYSRVNQESHFKLPNLNKGNLNEISIQTQKSKLPHTDLYVSIGVKGKKEENRKVFKSQNSHIYDGIIQYGNQVTLVIENKPFGNKIEDRQLEIESHINLEDSVVHPVVIFLEWADLITLFDDYSLSVYSSYHEKVVIGLFKEFVDVQFPQLGIYNQLKRCTSAVLYQRRIVSILNQVADHEAGETIDLDVKWMNAIKVNCPTIERVGIEPVVKDGELKTISIHGFYGLTLSQSNPLFKNHVSVFLDDTFDGWNKTIIYEIRAMFNEIKRFVIEEKSVELFINYFEEKATLDRIRQIPREQLLDHLNDLSNLGIIKYTDSDREAMANIVANKAYDHYRCSPGFHIVKSISGKIAIELDDGVEGNKLVDYIRRTIDYMKL